MIPPIAPSNALVPCQTTARSFSKVSLCPQDKGPKPCHLLQGPEPSDLISLSPPCPLTCSLYLVLDRLTGYQDSSCHCAHFHSFAVYLECFSLFLLTPTPILYLNVQSRTSSYSIVVYSVYHHSTLQRMAGPDSTGLSLIFIFGV